MRPSLRGKKLKRVRTPGGRIVYHRVKKKTNYPKCGLCGNILSGVPRVRPYELKRMAKTKKRPERMYAGILCPRCLKRKIIQAIMSMKGDAQ
jgi:large subunit ribosomal protein L34e